MVCGGVRGVRCLLRVRRRMAASWRPEGAPATELPLAVCHGAGCAAAEEVRRGFVQLWRAALRLALATGARAVTRRRCAPARRVLASRGACCHDAQRCNALHRACRCHGARGRQCGVMQRRCDAVSYCRRGLSLLRCELARYSRAASGGGLAFLAARPLSLPLPLRRRRSLPRQQPTTARGCRALARAQTRRACCAAAAQRRPCGRTHAVLEAAARASPRRASPSCASPRCASSRCASPACARPPAQNQGEQGATS
jgi:hypothetical protein